MIAPAYLAGILDGEGCIGTTRTGKHKNIVVRVMVANTDHDFLHRLQAAYGGSLNLSEKGHKPHWKPFGSITWVWSDAEKVLRYTLPYLLIKKKQAELALQLIDMLQWPRELRVMSVLRPTARMPNRTVQVLRPEVAAMQDAIADNIRRLNRKGIKTDREIAKTLVSLKAVA